MKKRKLIDISWTLLLCSIWTSVALAGEMSDRPVSNHTKNIKSDMGNHGMLVLGGGGTEGKIYVSHLPMFMSPHHFQGIWEVTFGASGDSTFRQTRQAVDRGGNPLHPYFTLRPNEDFPLRDLGKKKGSFRADIFARHFERPQQHPITIIPNAEVTIKNVVYFHEFGREPGILQFAEYVVFGSPQERFLAHRITHAPNYDQVVQVAGGAVANPIFDGAIIVADGQPDRPDRVLQKGQVVKGHFCNRLNTSSEPLRLEFELLNEYYREVGELTADHRSSE